MRVSEDRITDTSKNITLATSSLRLVINYESNSSSKQEVCELMVEMIRSGKDVLPFPPMNRYVLKMSVVIVFKGKKYPQKCGCCLTSLPL